MLKEHCSSGMMYHCYVCFEKKQQRSSSPDPSSNDMAADPSSGHVVTDPSQDVVPEIDIDEFSNLKTTILSGFSFTAQLDFAETKLYFSDNQLSASNYTRTRFFGVPPDEKEHSAIKTRMGKKSESHQRCYVYEHVSDKTQSLVVFWTDVGCVETISPEVWGKLCSHRY